MSQREKHLIAEQEAKRKNKAGEVSKKLGMTAEQTFDYFAMIEAH